MPCPAVYSRMGRPFHTKAVGEMICAVLASTSFFAIDAWCLLTKRRWCRVGVGYEKYKRGCERFGRSPLSQ